MKPAVTQIKAQEVRAPVVRDERRCTILVRKYPHEQSVDRE